MAQRNTYKIVLRGDASRKDGSRMLFVQGFISGQRVRLSLNVHVQPSAFDPVRQVVKIKGDAEKSQRINAILAKVKSRLEDLFFGALLDGKTVSPGDFLAALDAPSAGGSFLAFLEREMRAEKDGKADSTARGYQTMLNHLRQFKPDISFSEVDFEMIQGFDRFLRKKKIEQNTIATNHRRLRKFVLMAFRKKKIRENPYSLFKFREVQTERNYLTARQVADLVDLYETAELRPLLRDTLRHFLFQVGTSVRYSDLRNLEKSDLDGDLLVFNPLKTKRLKKVVKIPLSDMAWRMVQESESTGVKLFAVPVEQIMNRRLGEISKLVGLAKKITTHCARHTYGYLFIAAGGSVEVLQKIMGHSDIKTTLIYTHIDTSQIRAGVVKLDSILRAGT